MNKFLFIVLSMSLVVTSCSSHKHKQASSKEETSALSGSSDRALTFSLDGISTDGKSRWNVKGDTADISSDSSVIDITKVIANAYGPKGKVNLTADRGKFDKLKNFVHVESNVVVTTSDGIYLNTSSLDWDTNTHQATTAAFVSVQKDNLQVSGLGAFAQPDLKKILFKQENTVLVQPKTVITCSGPLQMDYEKNVAIFKDDVIVTDQKGRIFSDKMNVFFDQKTKKMSKAIAVGNVKIEQGLNNTFSQKAVYLAKEGKVILTGQPQLFIYPHQAKEGKGI